VRYYDSICDLIGKTPLVKLSDTVADLPPLILAKLEFMNPGGSVKDRMAYYMITHGEKTGSLTKDDIIIDNTSGNTGSGAAMVAAAKGYKSVFTTSEKTSKEKKDLIKSYGADVIVTPADLPHDDPQSYYMVARRIGQNPGYFYMDQYHSQINVDAHYATTGPEIWEDTDGKITHFICGIGTGGTISGTSKYLKERNPKVVTIGVDPVGSLFTAYSKGDPLPEARPYKVEGIGTDVITKAYLKEYVDDVIQVSDADSFRTARELCRREGISAGGSSGSVLWATRKMARNLKRSDLVVMLFPDSGIRYLSKLYNDDWMREHGFSLD
jgi:cystathionine beta-synthase